jgi:branched-chain amino acid transport system substrate-binding protein
MTRDKTSFSSRRYFMIGAATTAGLAAAGSFVPVRFAIGQTAKIKVGFMLPYTGTYAALGNNITDAFMLRVAEAGNKLGGREVDFIKLDSEANPAKAVDNATKLVKGDKVDFIVGPVHSGVAIGMTKVMKDAPACIMVNPNAGADEVTRQLCAANIFRTSFTNWQTTYPMGAELMKRGHKKVVTITWKYAAGQQMIGAFVEGYKKAGGGDPVEQMWVEFPQVEFQAFLTKIAALKPDAVMCFFAGGGAVKFMKDYAAAGLKASIPLYGAGFLTDGTIGAASEAADGLVTTLHYADNLDNAANKKFSADFKAKTGRAVDVYAVQGYDAGTLVVNAMGAVKGDTGATKQIVAAMEKTTIDSPRGRWTMSKAHNPIQDIYLRKVEGGINKLLGVAHKQLEDPGTGCKMG